MRKLLKQKTSKRNELSGHWGTCWGNNSDNTTGESSVPVNKNNNLEHDKQTSENQSLHNDKLTTDAENVNNEKVDLENKKITQQKK